MKRSRITSITCIMSVILLAAAAFAQETPVATDAKKLAVRDAQHKLDTIEKQQKDLGLQFSDIQQQVTTQSQKLANQHATAQADVDKANTEAKAGVDDKKWQWNAETLSFTAVPAPAAPANASTQPAKPASSGSPGAAVPPVQQAKK